MVRLFLLRWILGGLLLCVPALAQPAAPDSRTVLTPAEARMDADRDGLPDRAGERVRVAGRASVAVRLSESRLNGAIQSGRAGLSLTGEGVTVAVAPGDSVVATGTLVFRNGQLHLRTDTYQVVPDPLRVPAPRRLQLSAPLEPYEGMLVSFDATAVGTRRVAVGTILMLAADDSLFYALAFGEAGEKMFTHVHAGRQVRVTGVLGQHDVLPPYVQGYQVYPTSSDEVQVLGRGPDFYRRLVLAGALLLGLALAVIAVLLGRSRRRLARQLQSEHRYGLLFEHTDDGVFVLELPAGGAVVDLKLVALNKAAERMFGASFEDITKQGVFAFFEQQGDAEDSLARLLQERRHTSTLAMQRADGLPLTVELDTFLVEEGVRMLLIALMTDVTQRQAYERGLIEARERAEAYARLQESFVANMSHEIRTPLTGIIGFADVLREELTGEHRQFAEMIEAGGRRLLDTLDALLEMARIEAQGKALPLQPTDLSRVLQEAVGTLSAVARRREIELRVEAPDTLVTASNASAFERIVNNLVGNALKFTPSGGRVVATLQADGPEVVLTVQDSGVGISEAFQTQLFEPFAQEETEGLRPQGGTGLGLAITQRLVRMLGGVVTVESQKGEGATFTVRLSAPTSIPVEAEPADAA